MRSVLPTSARLLRLLSLLQSRRDWTGAALAERLDITERTVRRDVDRLRTLGYPVHSSAGVAGGYRLGAGAELPPLLLEDDEALAVAIGLRSAASGTVSGMEESAMRALAKLEQVLPTRLRRRMKALHAHIVPLHGFGPRIDADVLSTLASACREQQRVRFSYEGTAAAPSERLVEPHGLVHTASRWYLAAWDTSREDWRTFRVDRIGSSATTEQRFVERPLPHGSLAAFVSRSISRDVYPSKARVVLHAPAADIRERVAAAAGFITPLGEARCVLETGAHSLDHLAIHIALLGVDFEVESPPELVLRVKELGERLRRAGSASGKRPS